VTDVTNDTKFDKSSESVRITKITRDDSAAPVYPHCPECGSQVLEFNDRIACSRAEEHGCIFTITARAAEEVFYTSLDKVVANTITASGGSTIDLLRGLAFSLDKQIMTCHEPDHSYFGYFEAQIGKNSEGKWVLQITRDDEERAAIADEALARMYEEEGLS
jgi:hypothetical protein